MMAHVLHQKLKAINQHRYQEQVQFMMQWGFNGAFGKENGRGLFCVGCITATFEKSNTPVPRPLQAKRFVGFFSLEQQKKNPKVIKLLNIIDLFHHNLPTS